MGFMLKNRKLEGQGAVTLPSGPTAARPTSPQNGQIRYNTDTTRFEIYYNAWKQIAILGNSSITKDSFTGDGSTKTFTMSKTPTQINGPVVYVGNVHQNPGAAYSIASSSITFTSTPPLGQGIEIFHGFDSTDSN